GNIVAAGNDDGTVLVWDLRNGPDAEAMSTGLPGVVEAVRFETDSATLAWARCDGKVGRRRGRTLTLPGSAGHVVCVTFTSDGRTVVWGMPDGRIGLMDLADRKERGSFRLHTSPVESVTVSPDGRTAASADQDAILKVWDTASGREQATARGHRGHVH